MRGPEADGRDRQEDVLPRCEVEGPCQLERYTGCRTGKSFESGLGAAVAKISVGQGNQSDKTFKCPKDQDYGEVDPLGKAVEMDPNTSECCDHKRYVEMQEDFVAGGAKRFAGLQKHDQECNGTHNTGDEHLTFTDCFAISSPANLFDHGNAKGSDVRDRLNHDDPAKPAVDEVEVIVRDVQEANERVVASGHDNQGDHVDHRQRAGTVAKVAQKGLVGSLPLNVVDAQDDIHGNDSHKKQTLKPSWYNAEA